MNTEKKLPDGINILVKNWSKGLIILGLILLTIVCRQTPSLIAQTRSTASNPRLTGVMGSSQFQLKLQGQSGQVYEIQASTDLKTWTAIATNQASATGALTFSDSRVARYPHRFYRAIARTDLSVLGNGGFRSDRILVKPKAGVNLANLNLTLGVSVLQQFPRIGNLHIIKVPGSTTASTLIQLYLASGLVDYAENDFYVRASQTVQPLNDPNDPHYVNGDMWNLKNTGQYGGTPGADIHAPVAWDTTTTASNVIVAVVDTGIRYTHEDLAGNMWHNPQENLDGYTNDLYGINTVSNGYAAGDPWDDFGHGTHVSGTIGAVGNNGLGVVGVCWHVQLMALKFIDSTGNGAVSDAITCIDFARAHGAKVVNASWGAPSFQSQALHDAIASLRDADIVLVCAAGNSGADNDTTPLYPASYRDLDNIIAVAATDRNDQLASFSDYGTNSVDLAAPGTPIMSCWNGSDSDYQDDDGTSMSCAHVAGAIALLRGYYPNETYRQVIQQVLNGTDPLPSLAGKTISGGRLDLAKALGVTPPTLIASFNANPSSGQAPLAVQFTDTSTGSPTSWSWTFGDGASSSLQSPTHTYTNAASFTATLTVTGSGGQSSSASHTITVTNASTQVTASFNANPSSGQAPLAVQFTDTSTGSPTSWSWNFGDGATSSLQSPTHTYTNAASFTATLTVTGSGGQSSSASHTITVTNASSQVTASFTANPSSGPAPLAVQFTDTSTGGPTSWNWNFGDGTTASTQNPSHTYSGAGSFTATLTVANSGGRSSASQTITITNAPPPPVTASFNANPSSGQAPLAVQFTDTSTGGPTSWSWNFGDGTTASTQNPSHTYASAGSFTATLTVSGSGGQSSSARQTITVTNAPPPPVAASFNANPSSGQAPLAVQFTDTSTGSPTSWSWNFGDGTTASTQNPSHTYSSAGSFTATLTVANSGGRSSASQTITVTNAPPPLTASFNANPSSGQAPLVVQFTDTSTGGATAWSWNFGDGATSSSQNPSHTYSSAGNFTATLTVTCPGQSSSASQIITVTNAAPPPTVTVTATTPLASILSPGVFTLTRSGSTSSQLTVNYSLGGTAVSGTDYQSLSGSVVFPVGAATTTVVVQPIGLVTVLKTVNLIVSPNTTYQVGSPNSATVTIVVQLLGGL